MAQYLASKFEYREGLPSEIMPNSEEFSSVSIEGYAQKLKQQLEDEDDDVDDTFSDIDDSTMRYHKRHYGIQKSQTRADQGQHIKISNLIKKNNEKLEEAITLGTKDIIDMKQVQEELEDNEKFIVENMNYYKDKYKHILDKSSQGSPVKDQMTTIDK